MLDSVRRLIELRSSGVVAGSGPWLPRPRPSADSLSLEAISGGSLPAFAALFDRTSGVVRAELATLRPAPSGADAVFAATYLEVWWLAGCHTAPAVDVLDWVTKIVRRRIADARGSGADEQPGAVSISRPSYAELEVAALLGRPVDRLTRD